MRRVELSQSEKIVQNIGEFVPIIAGIGVLFGTPDLVRVHLRPKKLKDFAGPLCGGD